MTAEAAARLKLLNIEWVTTEKGYCMFTRGNCAALAQVREFGYALGSSAILTETGLAHLVWRGGQPFLVAHGGREMPAGAEQVDTLRHFAADLKAALASC